MEGKIYNLAGHRGQTATTTHAQQGRGTRVLCIPPLVSTYQVRLLTRQARKNYCDQMGVHSDDAVSGVVGWCGAPRWHLLVRGN